MKRRRGEEEEERRRGREEERMEMVDWTVMLAIYDFTEGDLAQHVQAIEAVLVENEAAANILCSTVQRRKQKETDTQS